MRPTTLEFLRAFKYNLQTGIIPDLSSPWPKQMATVMSGLLEYLITIEERSVGMLQEDNARLRALLEEVQRGIAPSSDTQARLREALQAGSDAATHVCREALVAENTRLQTAVEEVLPLLETHDNAPLLARTRAVLCERLETEFNTLAVPLMQIVRGG